MLHYRINLIGFKETKTAVSNLENQIKRRLRTSTKEIAKAGKKKMQKVIKPYNWTGVLYNSISIDNPTKYRTLLIVSAPHATAIDTGDIKMLPDFGLLKPIHTSKGMRYLWEGEEAKGWLSVHKPDSKQEGVLVGQSIDGKPFPKGLQFSDEAMEEMEKAVVNEIENAISELKF